MTQRCQGERQLHSSKVNPQIRIKNKKSPARARKTSITAFMRRKNCIISVLPIKILHFDYLTVYTYNRKPIFKMS